MSDPSFSCQRLQLPHQLQLGNAGIRGRYAIERAEWLWHPDGDAAFVTFQLELDLSSELDCVLSLSADQRYAFFINDQRVSRGPDRGDLDHWSFASYRLHFKAGRHVLRAAVWHVGGHAPLAQIFHAPGFICHADGDGEELITTGQADWRVSQQQHISFQQIDIPYYIAIGDSSVIDCRVLQADDWQIPERVRGPVPNGRTGVAAPGWKLCPSVLPDQLDRYCSPGRIRAVSHDWADKEPLPDSATDDEALAGWQALVDGDGVRVPPGTDVKILWDLDDYYCAYPELQWTGGKDAQMHLEWAEGLYNGLEVQGQGYRRDPDKGNRNEIIDKIWMGFGDTFIADGQPQTQQTFWWRSGRYLLLHIRTADEALELKSLQLNETRYPLEYNGRFECVDRELDPVIALSVRGMQMCSHETYMDCPYYEQLMYVGDTRLEMLCAHIMDRDDRLVKRGIELFDWSRVNWGFINERYPTYHPQHSPTFSLIWVSLLHDYACWRGNRDWTAARLCGMRCMLEHFEAYVNDDGLLDGLPGWAFMDWVEEWDTGYPPDGEFGCSGIVNLLYIMALQKAAELEAHYGEEILSRRYAAKAASVRDAVRSQFWEADTSVFADDLNHKAYSEHSQCLALLTGTVPEGREEDCLQALLERDDLSRCTVYFSFYLFETLYRFDRADELHARYQFWKNLHALGMRTPVEAPEPSRSDCHAWGSHPLFHLHASVAGVRPDGFGFERVLIKPLPGAMEAFTCETPHPNGSIVVTWSGDSWVISLPEGMTGTFVWDGQETALGAGEQRIES